MDSTVIAALLGVLGSALAAACVWLRRQLARERAERARERNEFNARLSDVGKRDSVVIDYSDCLVVSTDINGRVTQWNGVAERLTGVPAARAIGGDAFGLLVPAEAHKDARQALTDTLAGKVIRHAPFQLPGPRETAPLLDWNLVRQTDPQGKPIGVIAVARDISEKTRTEAALREREALLTTLDRLSPVGVILWNQRFEVRSWNAAAEQIFGHTAAQAMGRHATFIIPDDFKPYVEKIWEGLVSNTGGFRGTNINLTRDGRRIHCEWYNAPILGSDGKVAAVASYVEDVTDEVLARQRLEASEEHYRAAAENNQRLLREVNHRVRNNLAALIGLVKLIRQRVTRPDDFADALDRRIRAMANVHNLLAEGGWAPPDLRTLLNSLLTSMQSAAPHAAAIRLEGPPVVIDTRQTLPLAMAIAEFFANSVKYGAHSDPTRREATVHLEWSIRDDPVSPRLVLRWRETGGPPVTAPDPAPSLGTELVHGFVVFELGGVCELRYPPQGADHRIEFPIAFNHNHAP